MTIAELETLAVLVALETFKDQLKGKKIILHVDNTVTLYNLVKIRAQNNTIPFFCIDIWQRIHALGAELIVQYVHTKVNIADAFTRENNIMEGVINRAYVTMLNAGRPNIRWATQAAIATKEGRYTFDIPDDISSLKE